MYWKGKMCRSQTGIPKESERFIGLGRSQQCGQLRWAAGRTSAKLVYRSDVTQILSLPKLHANFIFVLWGACQPQLFPTLIL